MGEEPRAKKQPPPPQAADRVDGPVWDVARNTFMHWDPRDGWLEWSTSANQWISATAKSNSPPPPPPPTGKPYRPAKDVAGPNALGARPLPKKKPRPTTKAAVKKTAVKKTAVKKTAVKKTAVKKTALGRAELLRLIRRGDTPKNLRSADFGGAYLSGADFSGADLTNANLSGADLTNANLSGADLTDANLSGADLTGADLTGAIGLGWDTIFVGNAPYGVAFDGTHIWTANTDDGTVLKIPAG